jgi:hypothetical protein
VGPFSDRLLVHRDQFAAEFGARRILLTVRDEPVIALALGVRAG